ncbi:hypothetical protein AVEN_36667-1 [Araneus ventricosus]|uniref:Uncharacterized protein n=1 Tax=Araneus ventricosus TaxID=182803 RepID=A0A4Y2PYS5_ARAVE|nr:hypothetical protein AVEN_36667-1 [Araneus ventricosus]
MTTWQVLRKSPGECTAKQTNKQDNGSTIIPENTKHRKQDKQLLYKLANKQQKSTNNNSNSIFYTAWRLSAYHLALRPKSQIYSKMFKHTSQHLGYLAKSRDLFNMGMVTDHKAAALPLIPL